MLKYHINENVLNDNSCTNINKQDRDILLLVDKKS